MERAKAGRADDLNTAQILLWGCAYMGGSLERGRKN